VIRINAMKKIDRNIIIIISDKISGGGGGGGFLT